MKPKNKIYPLLRMLAVALTAALLGPGCQKDFKWNEPLAVTQNGLNLTSPAGSTRVTVYSTGRWKAEMAEGAWGEVSEVSGNGIGDFLFTYEANNGVSRRARILVSGEGEEQEIVLTQAGAVTEPTLALAETEFEFVRLPRYGVKGDVGTYQIRPVEEADIAFSREESTRNYSTLVRWAWPGMTTNAGIKQHADGSIVPYLGEGRMFSSVSNKLNTSSTVAGVSCTLDYNTLDYAKGIKSPAVRYNGIWWNSSRNEGEWVAFNFSTEGVSGSCMKMILSAALGNLSAATIVAPLYWDVSYSLDGSTFTRFDTVPIRTLVYWAGPQWYVPGLYEVDFDLPSACFGQKDVTIRLQAASKVCGSTTGEDNGTTTKTYVYFRFGDVSVKYF